MELVPSGDPWESGLSGLQWVILGVFHLLAAGSFVRPYAHGVQSPSSASRCECLALVAFNSSCLRPFLGCLPLLRDPAQGVCCGQLLLYTLQAWHLSTVEVAGHILLFLCIFLLLEININHNNIREYQVPRRSTRGSTAIVATSHPYKSILSFLLLPFFLPSLWVALIHIMLPSSPFLFPCSHCLTVLFEGQVFK